MGYADVLNHTDQAEHGIELLALASGQPALNDELKAFVNIYLKESPLSPEVLSAAYERGKSLDFDNVVVELLVSSTT